MATIDKTRPDLFAAQVAGAPTEPEAAPAPGDSRELVQRLRRFHFLGHDAAVDAIGAGSHLPALLFPFRDPERVRSDYPLFVGMADGATPRCESLGATIRRALEGTNVSQVLLDNIDRLEILARRDLAQAPAPRETGDVLDDAIVVLRDDLGLHGDAADRFEKDLDQLRERFPATGLVIPTPTQAPLHLGVAVARLALAPRRAAFRATVTDLCKQLEAALQIERSKDADAHGESHVSAAVGPAGLQLLDASALADVVGGHRGTKPMAKERRQRLEECLRELRAFLDAEPTLLVTVVGSEADTLPSTEEVEYRTDDAPCAAAAARFDELAAEWRGVFRAVRHARYALDPAYDPERHDAWVEVFGWEVFDATELHLLPAVFAIEAGFKDELSQLLLSGRRVHVLADQDPTDNDAGAHRFELAYIGMGHREAFVQQTTAARPDHVLEGMVKALNGTRTALTVVDTAATSPIGPWLHARAAVESRAHPLFCYDPDAGGSLARRLDFATNPSLNVDWSEQTLEYTSRDQNGVERTLAFTFADFALLDPEFAGHYAVLPVGFEHDDLCTVAEYLELPSDQAAHGLPFVWAVDGDGRLVQLLVTQRLARMTRERLGFWRTLQDLAGVRSETVDRAVAAAEAAASDRFQQELAELTSRHEEELQALRNDAATDAMQGLAQMLLDTDIAALDAVPMATPVTAAPVAPPATDVIPTPDAEAAPATDAAPAVEDDEDIEEAYVDTVLCTSCNDCINLNDRMFVYDDNKQVYLADATAGTYRQLVEAAEKCPAKCIHPGMPLDKSEADLDALIERAARFN